MNIQKFNIYLFVFIMLVIAGCAGLSEALKNNELVSRIAIKDTTIIAIGESSKTDEGRKANAQKIADAADQVTAILDGGTGTAISKETIVDTFRRALGGQDMPLYYKVILDDLVIILDSMYKPTIPTVEIPSQYIDDVKKVIGFIKDGTKLFL